MRQAQRGYSLIIAVTIIALLSFVGAMVLDAVHSDTQLAGGDRAAVNSMYVAEAGSVWGKQRLTDLLYPAGTPPGAPANPNALTVLTPLGTTDVLCPENACVAPPCPTALACSSYYLLTPSAWVTYGTSGQYRVAAACVPNCTAPTSFTLRAIGKVVDSSQKVLSQRLLELTLGQ